MQSNSKTSRSIQETLSDLHSIFIWGEKAAPFLQDLIEFIESLTPLMEEINTSLHESTKRFPSAQSQLDDVTKATELATNEILSLLEKSVDECNIIDQENQANAKLVSEFADFKTSLRSEIRESLSNSDPRVHVLHAKLWHQTEKLVTKLQASGDAKTQAVSSLRSGLNKILMSLQVQDITTQQISAVIHLIQSIRSRLSELYERLNSIKEIEGPAYSLSDSREEYLQSLNSKASHGNATREPAFSSDKDDSLPLESGATFDANASYDKSTAAKRQQDADSMVEKMLSGELAKEDNSDHNTLSNLDGEKPKELTSNEDINSLFASNGNKEASNEDIDSLFASNGNVEASNEEINSLFAQSEDSKEAPSQDIDSLFASSGEEASNEDIDKLFRS